MKKSVKQMHLILQEMRMIKGEITQQQPIKETWIDNIEVQSSLHVSESTLYRYRRMGKIPFSRIRGKIYYKKSDIRELLENNYQLLKPKCTCAASK